MQVPIVFEGRVVPGITGTIEYTSAREWSVPSNRIFFDERERIIRYLQDTRQSPLQPDEYIGRVIDQDYSRGFIEFDIYSTSLRGRQRGGIRKRARKTRHRRRRTHSRTRKN